MDYSALELEGIEWGHFSRGGGRGENKETFRETVEMEFRIRGNFERIGIIQPAPIFDRKNKIMFRRIRRFQSLSM